MEDNVYKTGIIRINKEPQYFIEMYSKGDTIAVYDVRLDHYDNNNNPVYGKDFKMVEKRQPVYTRGKLGKILNSLIDVSNDRDPKKVKAVKPPLFIADIEYGVDSFDGKYTLGFEERLPDTLVMNSSGNVVDNKHNEDTGVFIGLNKIHWMKEYFPLEDIKRMSDEKEENRWKI